jgi:chromosomal replication initiation ATPase DnaA
MGRENSGIAVDHGSSARTMERSTCTFIETLVGTTLGVDVGAMRTQGRGRAREALARQTAMYLAHVNLGLSLSRIGALFHRDRTTVAHACACVEDSRDDVRFEQIVACLEATLSQWRRWHGAPE